MMSTPAPDALPPQLAFHRYFFVQKYCFAAIGIDPTSAMRTISNHFLVWLPNGALLTVCFPMVIYASQHNDDMNIVTDALAPMWQASLAVMKLMLFLWNRKAIVQLVRTIWWWNLKATSEELKIIIEENRRDAIFSMSFFSIVFSTAILALAAPFIIALYNTTWLGYGFWDSLQPPLKGVYFMDPKGSYLGYIIAFLWDAVAVYAVIHTTLAVDTLFSWLMHNISANFRILNIRFKSLASINARPGVHAMIGAEDKFRKSLIHCVHHHKRIIEVAKAFDEVFKMTVFVKFTISFLQIAFLAFQLTRGGEFAGQLFHLSFLLSVSVQLMLYCYGGQMLTDQSISVAVAIYEHFHWQNLSVKSKKLLLLPLMRAQKPCILTGVFFVADLNLFLWVFKTAASFITMLTSLEDKND